MRAPASIARPRACIAILLLADCAALCVGAALSVLIWRQVGINFSTEFYIRLWPVLLLFPAAYAASGLYPGFGRNPADELRKLCTATSVVYGALAVTIFLLKDAATYSRGTFLLAWTDTLILVPLLRSVVRSVFSRKPWWGNPVVIIGVRRVTVALAATLESQPSLGFKPVAILEEPRRLFRSRAITASGTSSWRCRRSRAKRYGSSSRNAATRLPTSS